MLEENADGKYNRGNSRNNKMIFFFKKLRISGKGVSESTVVLF